MGAGAIGLAVVATVAFWPADGASSRPSPGASPSPSASAARDLPWGEPVPWNQVGPGWTLLAYDAVPEETEWGEDWSLAGDEIWLLSPDGTLYYGADLSDFDATYVSAWTGREVWLFKVTGYDGVMGIGTRYAVDLVTGEVTIVAENSPDIGSYEPTADDGIYLTRGGCCGCTEIVAHYEDGAVRVLNDGCGAARLSPNGTTVAYVSEWNDGSGAHHTAFMVTDLQGNSREVTDSPLADVYHEFAWLDDESLLILMGDGEGTGDNGGELVLATLDTVTGSAAPWSGIQPEGYTLNLWAGYPGSWLIWDSYDPVVTTRVTDRKGASLLDLECEYPSCWPYPTGDLVLWVESDITYEDGAPVGEDLQRLTIVDPLTGERTLVLEYTREDGHIATILPHPPTYG